MSRQHNAVSIVSFLRPISRKYPNPMVFLWYKNKSAGKNVNKTMNKKPTVSENPEVNCTSY